MKNPHWRFWVLKSKIFLFSLSENLPNVFKSSTHSLSFQFDTSVKKEISSWRENNSDFRFAKLSLWNPELGLRILLALKEFEPLPRRSLGSLVGKEFLGGSSAGLRSRRFRRKELFASSLPWQDLETVFRSANSLLLTISRMTRANEFGRYKSKQFGGK